MMEGVPETTTSPAWDATLAGMEPHGHIGAAWVPVWAYGVNLALPLAIAVTLLVRSFRLRRRANAASVVERGADRPPAIGQEVVRGVVETEKDPAVRVTVLQAGSESKHKKSWSTQWRETKRTVEAHPFVLVTASGARIAVEPDTSVELVDDLDQIERLEYRLRAKRAELTRGEQAIVLGTVTTRIAPGRGMGYRDAGQELVMRPGPSGMSISTHGLEAPLRKAAALRSRWAVIMLVMMVGAQLAAIRWHLASWTGHVESAVVVRRWQRMVKTKKGFRWEYSVVYRLASDGREVENGAEADDYPYLTEGRVIPVWVSPAMTTLGGGPTENGWFFFLPAVVLAGTLIGAIAAINNSKPWYERRALTDSRSGRLADDCPDALRIH